MEQQLRLKSLADDELLTGLTNIVRKGNQVAAELLGYLAELDERRLFLELGFSSLFEYCVESLGLCESTAWRHIAVARVCRMYPEAFAKVANGELHVSALSLMAKHLNPENAAELFEVCSRRSTRKVEELLAGRFPKPDVRDSVRRVPAQRGLTLNVESGSGTLKIEPDAVRVEAEAGPEGLAARPEPEKARRLEPLSTDRYGVHFTADGEFRELLERVRELAGHRLPSGDLMTLMKRGLEAYERELEKQRFAVGRMPRRVTVKQSLMTAVGDAAALPKRHVAAAVRREVYVRDGRQCTFVASGERRCGARQCLELDHVDPWAKGGDNTAENLRLRCRAHNQLHARRCYGAAHVQACVARGRERNRDPGPGVS